MQYIRVDWVHDHSDEPVTLFSEYDDEGWEIRKVEIFRDGRVGRASKFGASNGSMLSLAALPSLTEINKQPQFHGNQISQEEFEKAWQIKDGPVPLISLGSVS
jgi:hypothetical protein